MNSRTKLLTSKQHHWANSLKKRFNNFVENVLISKNKSLAILTHGRPLKSRDIQTDQKRVTTWGLFLMNSLNSMVTRLLVMTPPCSPDLQKLTVTKSLLSVIRKGKRSPRNRPVTLGALIQRGIAKRWEKCDWQLSTACP